MRFIGKSVFLGFTVAIPFLAFGQSQVLPCESKALEIAEAVLAKKAKFEESENYKINSKGVFSPHGNGSLYQIVGSLESSNLVFSVHLDMHCEPTEISIRRLFQ